MAKLTEDAASDVPPIRGDRVSARLEQVCSLGPRFVGTDGEREARATLAGWFEQIGLTDVVEEPFEVVAYRPGPVTLRSDRRLELGLVKGLQFTAPGTVRAPAVYAGRPEIDGTETWLADLDSRRVPLEGRIVVLHCSYPWLYTDELCARGARGIVVVSDSPDGLVQNLTARFYRGREDESTLREPVAIPGAVLEKEAGWRLLSDLSFGEVELELTHDAAYETVTTGNVVGRIPGTTDERYVVVGAHYDTQLDGYGANDNSAGLAAMLEIAAEFGKRSPRRSIVFAAFADEEHGLNGAVDFVKRRAPAADRIAGMVCLDSPGWSRLAKRCLHADETMLPFARACCEEAGWSPDVVVRAEQSRVTDHNAFCDVGVPACELERYPPGNAYYHTDFDTLERADPEAIAGAARAAGLVAWRLAMSETLFGRTDGPPAQTRAGALAGGPDGP